MYFAAIFKGKPSSLYSVFLFVIPTGLVLREASVKKKSHFGLTPIHCAATNSDTRALEHLYRACPDVHISDDLGRKLVHYAAGCTESTKPLEFLREKGANLGETDKDGANPLHIACTIPGTRKQKVRNVVSSSNDTIII